MTSSNAPQWVPDKRLPAPWRAAIWNVLFFGALGLLVLAGAYFFATGAYLFAALVFALLMAACAVLVDTRLITIVWLVGMPTLFVFPNNLLDIVPFLTVDRLIFFMVIGAFLVALAHGRDTKAAFLGLERLSLLFLALIAIGLAFGLPGREADQRGPDVVMGLHGYAMPLLGFFFIRRFAWSMGWGRAVAYALAFMGAALGLVALVQVGAGVNLLQPSWIELNAEHEGRATGAFANATEFGGACILSMVASAWLLRGRVGRVMRLALIGCFVLAVIGLGLCQTRATWVAGLAAFAFLGATDARVRPYALAAGVIGGAVLFISLPALVDSTLFRERIAEMSPIFNRLASFATALNVIAAHPFLGVGFGRTTFELAKPGFYADWGGVSGSYAVDLGPPHNEWVHVTAMMGVPAAILFVAVWVALWRLMSHIVRDTRVSQEVRSFANYARAFFVSLIVTSVFVDLGYFYYYVFSAWALCAVAAGVYENAMRRGAVGR